MAFSNNVDAQARIGIFQNYRHLFNGNELYNGYYKKIFNGSLEATQEQLLNLTLADFTRSIDQGGVQRNSEEIEEIAFDAMYSKDVLKDHNNRLRRAIAEYYGRAIQEPQRPIPTDCIQWLPKLRVCKIVPTKVEDLLQISDKITSLRVDCSGFQGPWNGEILGSHQFNNVATLTMVNLYHVAQARIFLDKCPQLISARIFIPADGEPRHIIELAKYIRQDKVETIALELKSNKQELADPISREYPDATVKLHTIRNGNGAVRIIIKKKI